MPSDGFPSPSSLPGSLLFDDDFEVCVRLAEAAHSSLRRSLHAPEDHLLSAPEDWATALSHTGLGRRYHDARRRLEGNGGAWQCLPLVLSCSVAAPPGFPSSKLLVPGFCCHRHLPADGPTTSRRWRLEASALGIDEGSGDSGAAPILAPNGIDAEEALWRYGRRWSRWDSERLSLSLEVPPTELPEMAAAKVSTLRRLGLPFGEVALGWDGPDRSTISLPTRILGAVRLLMCMDWEFYWLQYAPDPDVPFVTHWNELKVLKYLRTVLKTLIDQIDIFIKPSTGTEDGSTAILHQYAEGQRMMAKAVLGHLQGLADRLSPTRPPVPEVPESAELKAFHEWYLARSPGDPSVRACELQTAAAGRGLRAIRPIGPGDPIVAVPWSVVLSVDTALQSKYHATYAACGLDEEEMLMVFLIHEMNDAASEWAPYFGILPQRFESPLLWSASELLELEGSSVLEDIAQCRGALWESYGRLFPRLTDNHPTVFPEELFSYDQWVRARCIFDSRCFKINVEGKAHNCLVPLADMVNHARDGNVSFRRYDKGTGCVVLESLRTIPAGEEIRMNYGLLQNWEALMQYGMVDVNAREDSVHFDIDPSGFQDDPEVAEYARGLLQDGGLPLEHFLPFSGKPAPQLLAALRCCVMTAEDVSRARTEAWAPVACRPLVAANEEAACRALRDVVGAMLQAYPTTLEDDERELAEATEDTPSAVQLALRFRVAQKRILSRALGHCQR